MVKSLRGQALTFNKWVALTNPLKSDNNTGIFNIGFSKQAADQGPGLGLYNNIGSLQATYSAGLKDPTSLLGTALSFGYWSTGDNRHLYAGDRKKGFVNMILGDAGAAQTKWKPPKVES
jgi:hypothetical protein